MVGHGWSYSGTGGETAGESGERASELMAAVSSADRKVASDMPLNVLVGHARYVADRRNDPDFKAKIDEILGRIQSLHRST